MKKVETLLKNTSPIQIQDLLKNYAEYLKTLPGKKTVTETLSENAVYRNLCLVRTYLQECNIEPIQVSAETIQLFLKDRKDRTQEKNILKRFAFWLYTNKKLDAETINLIEEIEVKNRKEIPQHLQDPEKVRKWHVPYNRWSELYSQIPLGENGFQFALYIGLTFGLRPGEIANLKMSDFFLDPKHEDSFIKVQPHFDEKEELEWEPKTANSIRRIPVTHKQQKHIEEYFKVRKRIFKEYFPQIQHDYVIYSNLNGRNVSSTCLWTWFTKLKILFNEHGKQFMRQLNGRIVRYTCAVVTFQKTNDIYGVSKLLGHKDIETTELYLALSEQQRFDAVKRTISSADL